LPAIRYRTRLVASLHRQDGDHLAATRKMSMLARVGEGMWSFYTRGRRAVKRRLLEHFRPIDQGVLVSALAQLIQEPREFILMHSSLSRCGHIHGGEGAVINAIDQFCDNLCLPTHTYCYPSEISNIVPVFDPRSTESRVGQITKYYWRRPGVIRSIHPTHSLAARGPRSQELCASHELCETPCGGGTPYAKLVSWDASVLLFGVAMDSYTLFHTAEDAAACPYLYEKKPYQLKALSYDGTLHHVIMRKQDGTVSRRFKDMDRVFENNGLLRRARLGLGELLFIPSSRRAHEFLQEKLRKDPYFLVAGDYPRPRGK